jgi:NADPH:quinone reductase-like Zn-dependent oxidoreductase
MKALRFHEYGGPEVLKIEDVPVPEPGPGEVLVRVSGSGINPVDWKVREGHMKDAMPLELPQIAQWEFSGTIEKLGDGVEGYAVGDDIYGIEHRGTCADYIVANPKAFAKAPPTMDLPDAGGIPLAATTAWQGLFDQGGLQAGQKVLIHAASGGVGTFAVQFAKWAGAYVYGTASANRLDTIQDLGADRPIDYKADRFEEIATDVDLVLDLVGGETATRSLASLKEGGILVSTVGAASEEDAKAQGKRSVNFMMQPSPEQLTKIGDLINDLKVRPVIDAVVPLIRAVEAQKEVQEGHTLGKMVVDVRR